MGEHSNGEATVETKVLNLHEHLAESPLPTSQTFTHLTLVLDIESSPRFQFHAYAAVRIGRQSRKDGEPTEILDLSVYDGEQYSVSRQHCYIYRTEKGYFLEDLDSLNGTWLNGIRVKSEKPAAINHSDYIMAGKVGLWVYLPGEKEHTPS
jgi:pSer/pThr/pTyr-binding forkhead associated (FHA) protein